MRVVIEDLAKENLIDIYYYNAQYSLKNAIETNKNILKYIYNLESSTYIGRCIPEIFDNRFQELIYRKNRRTGYRIMYYISENNNTIYIKEGEEISKFLAFIEAQKSVLKFEEIRVMKDLRNDVNRKVNCETANLNKTIEAAVMQIDAINFLKKMKKFEELPDSLIEIAEVRVENPEVSLKDLGNLLENPIGKSGVNHRLKKIVEIAEEIKKGK